MERQTYPDNARKHDLELVSCIMLIIRVSLFMSFLVVGGSKEHFSRKYF